MRVPWHTGATAADEKVKVATIVGLQHMVHIQALVAAAGMTASRFIRHFKAATGVTPGAYRLNLRINGTHCLLAQGHNLADAAHHMGFADQAHMQRAFKTYHSLTPGNYAAAQD